MRYRPARSQAEQEQRGTAAIPTRTVPMANGTSRSTTSRTAVPLPYSANASLMPTKMRELNCSDREHGHTEADLACGECC